jgi:hypothetical protein
VGVKQFAETYGAWLVVILILAATEKDRATRVFAVLVTLLGGVIMLGLVILIG